MSKHDLQNERFERIERSLLKSAKLSSDEIEKIVTAPHLFAAVEAKIRAEKQARREPRQIFSRWASWFAFLNRQKTFAATAILLAAAAGTTIIVFRKQGAPQLTAQTIDTKTVAKIKPENERIENSIESGQINNSDFPEIAEIEKAAVKNPEKIKPNSSAERKQKLPRRVRKQEFSRTPENAEIQTPQVFYSLTIGGSWEAEGEDLQVVRTELSRAELFALGVNLPDANEAPKIKTDLLVSANGVPRAIRFVE